MIPSPPINDRYQNCFCWLAARDAQARIHRLNSQTAALAIAPRNPQRHHWQQLPHPHSTEKPSLRPFHSHFVSTAGVPKSP
jgi:hypothetical protein